MIREPMRKTQYTVEIEPESRATTRCVFIAISLNTGVFGEK